MRRPHKYGAKATVVDNIRFASQKEAARYRELKLLEKAGRISGLKLQPAFDLMVVSSDMRTYKVGEYVADFFYYALPDFAERKPPYDHPPFPSAVYEDVKGFKTPLYRWKKKHVEAQYGIEIREV